MPTAWERFLVAGAAWGPALFIGAWVAAGLATPGYSAIESPISELAAVDAHTRLPMTAGLAAYALGVGGAAWPLRRLVGTPSAIAMGASAVLTVGVAAVPLGISSTADVLHAVIAALAYAATVAIGLLAGLSLLRGGERVGAVAIVVAAVSAVFLVASALDAAPGLFQRLGLTTTDAWLIGLAIVGAARGVRERSRP